jgi:hypothetical protein
MREALVVGGNFGQGASGRGTEQRAESGGMSTERSIRECG